MAIQAAFAGLRQRVWFRTLVRVIKEVWLPAGLAVCWTIYSLASKGKWNWADAGQTFGGAFLFLGFFAGYVVRSHKVVLDQDRHATLLERQESIVTRLEQTAQDVMNYATGGDSYAYGSHFFFSGGRLNLAIIAIEGKYPLYELRVAVSDANARAALFARKKSVSLAEIEKTHIASLDFGAVPTSMGHRRELDLPLSRERTNRFDLSWTSRNGTWYQRLEVQYVDGRWQWATYVKRDQIELREEGSPDYPRTADGKLKFTHGSLET